MLGVSGLMNNSGVGGAAAEIGGGSGGSSEVGTSSSAPVGSGVEENGRLGGGNRWPRQETLALLKIRSDMDATFRDASLKGPLWEDVSKKMGELGFERSGKKCKEKFENVFKYHKRTKGAKSDGKSYRFFDQLEALGNTYNHFTPSPPPQPPRAAATAAPVNLTPIPIPSNVDNTTVPSESPVPLSVIPPINSSSFQPQLQPQLAHSTSSSTSSDEDTQRRSRKRKWKDQLERLMTDVLKKQDELQKKFLEALEKRERDQIAREEAWRTQEIAMINREHDLLAQERSIAANRDAAVIAFLQKVTGQTDLQIPQPPPQNPPPPPPLPPQSQTQPIAAAKPTPDRDNGGDDHISGNSSRWPKAEVEALIKLRTGLEIKYQENGPKGPLWEKISKRMRNLGYKRSPKRCKEKWENINKYFKKVKEGSKKRSQDSKTCTYFNLLDAIYKERTKNFDPMKPENPPIMARPEQQWHPFNEDDEDEAGEYEMIANTQPS